MLKDATGGGHASVHVQCDHDVIVHSWGSWDVGACSTRGHHELPLLTALFLPVFFFFIPSSSFSSTILLRRGPDDDSGAAPL